MRTSISAFSHNTIYLKGFTFGTVATLLNGRYDRDAVDNVQTDFRQPYDTWREQQAKRDAAIEAFYTNTIGVVDVTFSGLSVDDVIALLKDASPEVWVERRVTSLNPYSPVQVTSVDAPFRQTSEGFSVDGFTFYVYGAVHVLVEATR